MSITSTSTNSAIAVDNVALDAGQDLDLVTNPPVNSNSQAQATVVTGEAEATADNIAAGFKDLLINNVGEEALLNALVSGTTISSSRSITGNTSSDANSSIAAGMTQTKIDRIGTNATILGQQKMVTNADAGSISGEATANAVLGQLLSEEWSAADVLASGELASLNAVGGIVGWNNSFSIGQNGQVTGRSGISTNRNFTGSLATSVTGNSNASTQVPSNYGISLNELSIGQEGSVIGEVAADQSAQALTTTGDSKANVQTTRTAGLQVVGSENFITEDVIYTLAPDPSASEPSFTIGTNGNLKGKALLDSSATSKSVTQAGDGFGVSASVGGDLGPGGEQTVYGISLPGSFNIGSPSFLSVERSSDRLRIGMDGGINAEASVNQEASAEVVTGSSLASGITSPNTLIAGLGGNLSIHNNATELNAIADLAGSSKASSVTGNARALNGNQYADLGLSLEFNVPETIAPTELYLSYSLVNGIGGELASSVVIGADLAGGALLKGRSNLSSEASTVTGDAAAFNAGQVFGSRSVNFDIGNSILNADGSRGTATFQAIGSASTEASTITANAEEGGAVAGSVMQGAGFVGTPLNSWQVLGSSSQWIPTDYSNENPNAERISNAIEIGQDGNLSFSSNQTASSTASAITAGPAVVAEPVRFAGPGQTNEIGYTAGSERTAAGSVATTRVNSFGLAPYYVTENSPLTGSNDAFRLSENLDPDSQRELTLALNPQSVIVGGSGNITATALSEGEAVSSNVTGSSLALSDSNSIGISLLSVVDNRESNTPATTSEPTTTRYSSDIAIGDTGNILSTGLSNLKSAAETITGESQSATNLDAFGIFGSVVFTAQQESEASPTNLPVITAGPNGGNIIGNAVGLVSTESSSVKGNSTSNTLAELGGLFDVTLTGGQVAGDNRISGFAIGDLETAASTITGNAAATSEATASGIFYSTADPGSINVNGNINAIAQLSNTVTASTVTGDATANVTNSVVGIGNANITIGQSGSITASAVSNSTAIAQSITA